MHFFFFFNQFHIPLLKTNDKTEKKKPIPVKTQFIHIMVAILDLLFYFPVSETITAPTKSTDFMPTQYMDQLSRETAIG